MIENDNTHKETAYKHESIIRKFGGDQKESYYLEMEDENEDEDDIEVEIDNSDDDNLYEPNTESEEVEIKEEELDEKEYIRDICF